MPTSMTLPTLLPLPVTVSITSLLSPWRHSHWLGWRLRTCPKRLILRHLCSKKYQPLQLRFHQGVILPIGEEPSGRSWTGFQSTVSGTQGYLVVYREDNEQARGTIDTWLPEGKKVDFIPVMGSGKKFAAKVGAQGRVSFELNDKNSFALYQYEVKP